jgi:hypothetical protein
MFRSVLTLLAVVGMVGPASAQSWATGLFDELSRDFGTVQRGPAQEHAFRLTNRTPNPITITGVRVSCGCVSASVPVAVLKPGETTAVNATMDTRRFAGPKTVTIFVSLSNGMQLDEVRLTVSANMRDDLAVTPDSFAFGQMKRGTSPSKSVQVTILGAGQWHVTHATCESNYVRPQVKELRRSQLDVMYEVTATIRADVPVGKWYTDVWVHTNHPSLPKIRIPLHVEVQRALTASPAVLQPAPLQVGQKTPQRLLVRGDRPFRIRAVKGMEGVVRVEPLSDEARVTQVVQLTIEPVQAGPLQGKLIIETDSPEDGLLEVPLVGVVAPPAAATPTPSPTPAPPAPAPMLRQSAQPALPVVPTEPAAPDPSVVPVSP